MQYLLLIYDNEQRWTKGYDAVEMTEYRAFGTEFAAAIKGGHALQATGTAATVRMRNGHQQTTYGPFAETKEQLAGYYLLDCEHLDEAIEWGKKFVSACGRFGDRCFEIRPLDDHSQIDPGCHVDP